MFGELGQMADERIHQSNGCLLNHFKEMISWEEKGTIPKGPIEDLDACSSACKSHPGCEVFSFQLAIATWPFIPFKLNELSPSKLNWSSVFEGTGLRAWLEFYGTALWEAFKANTTLSRTWHRDPNSTSCLLFPGNAVLTEVGGMGTIGHCLPGDSFFNF